MSLIDVAKEQWEPVKDKLQAAFLSQFGADWSQMLDEDRARVQRALTELAKIEAKAIIGQGADPERIALLKATIGNWVMKGEIHAKRAQIAFWKAVQDVAKDVGQVAFSILGKMAVEALKGFAADLKNSR